MFEALEESRTIDFTDHIMNHASLKDPDIREQHHLNKIRMDSVRRGMCIWVAVPHSSLVDETRLDYSMMKSLGLVQVLECGQYGLTCEVVEDLGDLASRNIQLIEFPVVSGQDGHNRGSASKLRVDSLVVVGALMALSKSSSSSSSHVSSSSSSSATHTSARGVRGVTIDTTSIIGKTKGPVHDEDDGDDEEDDEMDDGARELRRTSTETSI